ncbi:MAG: tyrosine-type recombinase/integrase [Nitrospirota bacterium]|nr:tyrosine-type recombinase/integrase [Nitrospirota bacterium]
MMVSGAGLDGEIYELLELPAKLESEAYRFRSHSDMWEWLARYSCEGRGVARSQSRPRCDGEGRLDHKWATCHNFRHAVVTHELEGGYDIRTVQKFLWHRDVKTTKI